MRGIVNITLQKMQLINMQKDGINAGNAKYLSRRCILQKQSMVEFTSVQSVLEKIQICNRCDNNFNQKMKIEKPKIMIPLKQPLSYKQRTNVHATSPQVQYVNELVVPDKPRFTVCGLELQYNVEFGSFPWIQFKGDQEHGLQVNCLDCIEKLNNKN